MRHLEAVIFNSAQNFQINFTFNPHSFTAVSQKDVKAKFER